MLFHMDLSVQVLHADVMNAKVVARSHRSYAVKDALLPSNAGNGANNHIRVGKDGMHRIRNLADRSFGMLKCNVAANTDRYIRKVSVPCLAYANAVYINHS